MLSTGHSVGLSAGNVAHHTTACVAASVARAVGVRVLAMLSARDPVCLCAWDVAHQATATSVAAGGAAAAIALVVT